MTEDFLFHLWRYRNFDSSGLCTISGEPVRIIRNGEYNPDAGPDFFNARIKIGETEWAGNVEIHVRSSDWDRHCHQHDAVYDNTILHVVYEYDLPVIRKDKSVIPVLELKGRFDLSIWRKYRNLQKSTTWIPCANQIEQADPIILTGWLDRMLVERMEQRSNAILQSVQLNKSDWENSFYVQLAKNFGFKVNALPFELLAKSLPLLVLSKHRNVLPQIEALLFGQSGFLNGTYEDIYPVELKKEYVHLRNKFSLQPIASHLWKFLRMRPSNFPTLRIAQFASLMNKRSSLFPSVLECDTIQQLQKLFAVAASAYWDHHYQFDKYTEGGVKRLGEESIANVIINTIAPFIFVYGRIKKEDKWCDRALRFMEQIPPESNSIITNWKKYNIHPLSAAQSQSMIQLKNNYCIHKKCLNCAIGNSILNQSIRKA